MKTPMISIIIPVYNVEKYVGECINSVINQTYTNLEILINNDGSTDNSYQICQSYAQIDPRIKLYSQENKGVSIARNAMLEKAIGEYVLFIDPDDFILPTHVERLLNLLNEYDADASACGYIKFSNENTVKCHRQMKEEIILYNGIDFAIEITRPICMHILPVAWSRLIKRSCLNNFSFPAGRINEDRFAMPLLMCKLKSVVYTNDALYMYRDRSDSIMHTRQFPKSTDHLDAFIFTIRYGVEYDSRTMIWNGAYSFLDGYLKQKAILLNTRNKGRYRFNAKYDELFRMCLHLVLQKKYKPGKLLYKELIPLR